jgi:glycosyltransferase involved in cell wall biosynthesis
VSGPLVTIVTPSFNQGAFIRQTIESVLAQDYQPLEYIVMDGGSTDETASVVEPYRDRLLWVSEKDRGQAHAINKGFASARGEILAWLNSDDVLLPGAVSRAVRGFAEAPRTGAVYGEGHLMDRTGKVTGRFPATERFNLWRLTYLSDYILQQSTFFRRDAVEAVGGLDESLHYALDWDLLIRLGKRFGLHYLPTDLGVLREYSEAKTFSGGDRRIREIRDVLQRHTGLARAPGYWLYAFDNLHRGWEQRVTAYVPRRLSWLARLLHLPVYLPAALAIRHILYTAQGLYPDGWASDRVKWMVPEGAGEIVVRGRLLPQLCDGGIVLAAVANNRELGRWAIREQDFEVRFSASSSGAPVAFELCSSRYRRVVWRRPVGVRRVAFLLHSAEWA